MKMKIIDNINKSDWSKVLQRPTQTVEDIEETVNQIFQEVKQRGSKAVAKYTEFFDNVKISQIEVSEAEINEAILSVPDSLKEAITIAKKNIECFHKAQKTEKIVSETMPGVICWQEKKPIESVGLYIPGGTAPLFSTVLMLAVPAKLAGCKEIVLVSPPNDSGKINPAILFTAALCGVDKIFKVGGIQAIAGLTFGTTNIPKVSKIFGPGNQFVTVAKQLATKYGVAIDMPAGPSELLIVADQSADPSFVASDLLSQAEHGADSQVILVTTSKKLADDVILELNKQLQILPRKDIASKAIDNSKIILVSNNSEALDMINEYGPEHFIICVDDTSFFTEGITNAGSVFIGNYTPESAGDYASGTNHTLPTNGFSKAYSGVNLDSFMKSITFQNITKTGLLGIGNAIELMAEAEGLFAHKNAVTLRLNKIKNDQ